MKQTQMNKLLRNKLKRKQYIRRIKLIAAIDRKSWTDLDNADYTQCYKTTGKPCSCVLCSREKYNRSKEKTFNPIVVENPSNELLEFVRGLSIKKEETREQLRSDRDKYFPQTNNL